MARDPLDADTCSARERIGKQFRASGQARAEPMKLASILLLTSAFSALYILLKTPNALTYFLTGQVFFGLLLLTFAFAINKRKVR